IFRPARLVLPARIGARRLARRLVIAEFAVIEGVAGGSLRALHGAVGRIVGGRLRLVGAHLLRRVAVGRAFGAGLIAVPVRIVLVVVVLVGLGVAVVAEIERRQQVVDHVAEPGLILGNAGKLVEPRTDLVLQGGPPKVDHLL